MNTIQQSTQPVIYRYSLYKKILATAIYLVIVLCGIFCIQINILITIFVGIVILVAAIVHIIDILFFKSIIINDTNLIKNWYLIGSKKIALPNLYAYNQNKIWKGFITFHSKDGGFIKDFGINMESFLLKNANLEDVRNTLISKGIITGEEKSWTIKKKVSLLKRVFK